MIPVFQSIVDPVTGDCYRACLASICELPLDQVPHFTALAQPGWGNGEPWLIRAWCRSRGLVLLQTRLPALDVFNWFNLPGAYAIATVPSQRFHGVSHAVVAQWQERADNAEVTCLKIVHDPNPGNAPYPDDQHIQHLDYVLTTVPCLRN